MTKDTGKHKANAFGSYAIMGNSVRDLQERSKEEDVVAFLEMVRTANPSGRILLVLDNFKPHHRVSNDGDRSQDRHLIPSSVFARPESHRVHLEGNKEGYVNCVHRIEGCDVFCNAGKLYLDVFIQELCKFMDWGVPSSRDSNIH